MVSLGKRNKTVDTSTDNTQSNPIENKLNAQLIFTDSILNDCANISNISNEITSSLEEISSQLQVQDKVLNNTIDVTAQVSACSEEMTASVDESMLYINKTLSKAHEGQASLSNMSNGLNNIKEVSSQMSNAIIDLSNKTNQIVSVTETIKKISQSTKMLSINAKLEASRAGQYGASFAVVAQEINKLSINSAESADEINTIIEEISEMMNNTLDIVSNGVSEIDSSTTSISQSGNVLSDVIKMVENLRDISSQINIAVKDQAVQNQGMLEAIDELISISSDLKVSIVNLTSNTDTQCNVLDNINSRVKAMNNVISRMNIEKHNTIKLRLPMDPISSLDPTKLPTATHNLLLLQINRGLVDRPNGFNIVGSIAQNWTLENDNLTWSFKLREDMKFHNGDLVTSDDVIYSFTRILSKELDSKYRYLFTNVEGADDFYNGKSSHVSGFIKTGKFSFKIKLTRPHSKFINVLSKPVCSIIPNGSADIVDKAPIGCGPYTVESFDSETITLKKFNDYTLNNPIVDEIVMDFTNPESRVSRFIDGEFDFTPVTNSDEVDLLAEAGYTPERFLSGGIRSLSFNFNSNNPIIHDRDVRKALNYCVDKQALSSDVYNNLSKFSGKVFANEILDNSYVTEYNYDLTKAKEFMSKSTLNGGSLKLLIRTDGINASTDQKMFDLLKDTFSSINIDLIPVETTSAEYYTKATISTCDLFLLGWVDSSEDIILEPLVNAGSSGNFTGYNNDDFISSVKELQTIKNPYEYRENLRLLEKDIMEDSPWIFLGAYNYNLCSKAHVHGLEYDFSAAMDFSNVWVD